MYATPDNMPYSPPIANIHISMKLGKEFGSLQRRKEKELGEVRARVRISMIRKYACGDSDQLH